MILHFHIIIIRLISSISASFDTTTTIIIIIIATNKTTPPTMMPIDGIFGDWTATVDNVVWFKVDDIVDCCCVIFVIADWVWFKVDSLCDDNDVDGNVVDIVEEVVEDILVTVVNNDIESDLITDKVVESVAIVDVVVIDLQIDDAAVMLGVHNRAWQLQLPPFCLQSGKFAISYFFFFVVHWQNFMSKIKKKSNKNIDNSQNNCLPSCRWLKKI